MSMKIAANSGDLQKRREALSRRPCIMERMASSLKKYKFHCEIQSPLLLRLTLGREQAKGDLRQKERMLPLRPLDKSI